MDRQFDTVLKILRTDNVTECVNHLMACYLAENGILHHLSCPYTPEQNGIAERKHQHIVETAIALMYHSSMPLTYWFEALATAVFLINRMPSLSLHHKSPFQLLFHALPDYEFFKVFGCQCFPWLRPYIDHKLQPRSLPCVFLGYHPFTKGYLCLDPSTGKIFLSRHVLFNESCFPFATQTLSSPTLPILTSYF